MKLTTCNVAVKNLIFTNLLFACTCFIDLSTALSNFSVSFVLGDETQPSFFIGNILNHISALDTSISAKNKLRATMLDSRGLASKLLHLNDMGDLYTVAPIDRDDKHGVCGPLDCCQEAICSLTFEAIFVSTFSTSIVVSVTIDIIDLNDNAPYFQAKTFTLAIPEYVPINFQTTDSDAELTQMHSLPKARDGDALINGISRYELSGEGVDLGYFSISNLSSACFPCLIISKNANLDYENPNHRHFALKLTATDGGIEAKSSTIDIYVKVVDLNDNAPVFLNTTHTVQVSENRTYPRAIYTVQATDADSGHNSKLHYSIISPLYHSINSLTKKFELDTVKGDLVISASLDYENFLERNTVLLIIAYDDGRPSLSATCTLTVFLSDINDNLPELLVQQNNTIMENSKPNQLALQMIIRDLDDISQGQIQCKLELNQVLPLKLISAPGEMTVSIWTTDPLDYEKFQLINFELSCLDLAEPSHISKFRMSVKVGNRNDNGPRFFTMDDEPTNFYEISVRENQLVHNAILQPRVFDVDSPKLLFYLSSESLNVNRRNDLTSTIFSFSEQFTVQRDTGEIYLKSALDYETSKYYEFHLIAQDKPAPNETVYTSEVLIRIKVLDMNDNQPILVGPNIIIIEDGTTAGSQVAQITFLDQDEDGNQKVYSKLIDQMHFSLYSQNDSCGEYPEMLALKENGALVTLTPLLSEKVSMISLLILAVDQSELNQLSTTATITIIVRDIANIRPYLIQPFPGTTVKFNGTVFSKGSSTDVNQNPKILIETYSADLSSNNTTAVRLSKDCNGSQIFQLDLRDNSLKLLPTDDIKDLIINLPSRSLFKVCLLLIEKTHQDRTNIVYFYVSLNFNFQTFGQAYWPSDSAEPPNILELYSGTPLATSTERNLSNTRTDEGDTQIDRLSSRKIGSRLSFSNIIMCMLIFSFCLAVGFALFAAILWARAKQASSAHDQTINRRLQHSCSTKTTRDDGSARVWKSRSSYQMGKNSPTPRVEELPMKHLNSMSSLGNLSEDRRVWNDLEGNNDECMKSLEENILFTGRGVSSQDLKTLNDGCCPQQLLNRSENVGIDSVDTRTAFIQSYLDGPIVAYFDLIVSTPSNIGAKNDEVSKQNIQTLLMAKNHAEVLQDLYT